MTEKITNDETFLNRKSSPSLNVCWLLCLTMAVSVLRGNYWVRLPVDVDQEEMKMWTIPCSRTLPKASYTRSIQRIAKFVSLAAVWSRNSGLVSRIEKSLLNDLKKLGWNESPMGEEGKYNKHGNYEADCRCQMSIGHKLIGWTIPKDARNEIAPWILKTLI